MNECGRLVAQAACGRDLKAGGRATSQTETRAGLLTGQVLSADIPIDTTKEPDGVAHGGRRADERDDGRQLRRFGIELHVASVMGERMKWLLQCRGPVDAAGNGQYCGHGVTASCWLPGS